MSSVELRRPKLGVLLDGHRGDRSWTRAGGRLESKVPGGISKVPEADGENSGGGDPEMRIGGAGNGAHGVAGESLGAPEMSEVVQRAPEVLSTRRSGREISTLVLGF